MRILFYLTVILHFYIIIVNVAAFVALPFLHSVLGVPFWYYVLLITPIESLIIVLTFSNFSCPLTRLENYFRVKLGLPKISKFIAYYFLGRKS